MKKKPSTQRRFAVLLLSVLFSTLWSAATSADDFDHSHSLLGELLKEQVSAKGFTTTVDYEALKSAPSRLEKYLEHLQSATRRHSDSWNREQKLAFLINAYNAFTLKLILDHYPLDSIRDIDKPWATKFFTLLGERRSLDQLEHNMIRRYFDEPRIHFAVNCAAISCPPLRAEAYTADHLNRQLEDAARNFLRDQDNNSIEKAGKQLVLSSIFKWYGDDFKRSYGGFLDFISSRITDDAELQERIRRGKLRIRYRDYDWGLNVTK